MCVCVPATLCVVIHTHVICSGLLFVIVVVVALLQHGDIEDGKFLVRQVKSGSTNSFYIDLMNNGVPSTLTVTRPKPKKGEFTTYKVNNKETQQTSIELVSVTCAHCCNCLG